MLPSTSATALDLFQPVVERTGAGSRIRARGAWTVASSVVQAALVVLAATVSTQFVAPDQPVIPVKIARTVQPAAPPAPPPAPAAAKPPAAPQPPKAAPPRRAPATVVQPRTLPAELKPLDPNEPIEEEWYGDVEGGVVGGVVGAIEPRPAPPVAIEPKPKSHPEQPVRFRNEMTPPVFLAGTPLEYTQQALEREIEGTMVVECVVDVNGTVHACRIVRGLPFLDRATIANLEQRRYRPATLDGRPLSVTYTFTLKFALP